MRWLFALILMLCGSAAFADTFRFTAIPDEDQSRLVERFSKIADYLSDRLGVDVEYVPVTSYGAAVTAFRNDQVQLAWFGGLSGVQARQLVPGSQAIAQSKEDAEFRSYFIANTAAGITEDETADVAPEQDALPGSVRGHTFTFGAKTSTSGRLMPEHFIRQRFDAAPETVFSRVGFSGDHTRTIALVESGTYDVGAVNFTVWQAAVEDGRVDTDKVEVIWKSPAYPDYQWTLRGDVDERYGEGFAQKVQQALLGMTDPELLRSFPRSGFIPASNDDYAPIESVSKSIGLLR